MIDHVTVHVMSGWLRGNPDVWTKFFDLLGMVEVEPNDKYEHGYNVRWWAPNDLADTPEKPYIHLVETEDGERDLLSLGHFCVSGIKPASIRLRAERLGVMERFSGSGRCWLSYAGVRVEVRP